ncbi:hypothetical protein OH492_25755 [Vibrio chagasii]|nr:hypothetical protein [Vibrio chagasii]
MKPTVFLIINTYFITLRTRQVNARREKVAAKQQTLRYVIDDVSDAASALMLEKLQGERPISSLFQNYQTTISSLVLPIHRL